MAQRTSDLDVLDRVEEQALSEISAKTEDIDLYGPAVVWRTKDGEVFFQFGEDSSFRDLVGHAIERDIYDTNDNTPAHAPQTGEELELHTLPVLKEDYESNASDSDDDGFYHAIATALKRSEPDVIYVLP